MPKPRPLTQSEARRTLANRFAPRADRLRQLSTKFGLRPMRVFLVWAKWSGDERGEGRETELARLELLPTPKVTGLDGVAYQLAAVGVIPTGTVRVSEISAQYTEDTLTGRSVPAGDDNPPTRWAKRSAHIPEGVDFFWELVEDGRGDEPPPRRKFRLADQPMRDAGRVQWMATLERVGEDHGRGGQSEAGPDRDPF